MKLLWRFFFGCPHALGWPITLNDRTYRVCSKCGARSPVSNPLLCQACRFSRRMTRPERRATIHPETMWSCPRILQGRVCGRKLRGGPRDKKRSWGTKS